ncbi:MAG: nucleoside/nucleotide kinase family protein [Gaiellaceae bacterium]
MSALLLAIEGIDGSGKGTQAARLAATATDAGYRVASFSFPRYDANPFSRAISAYLNGDLGRSDAVHPQLAALLYACDRLHARPELVDALDACDLVVCDRYVASNIAHQGAKVGGDARAQLVEWLLEVEYGELALPRPELVVLLDAPAPLARELVARKGARSYTTLAADILEADAAHGAAAREIYLGLAQRDGWRVVSTAAADDLVRDVDDVAAEVWAAVEPRLRERR